MQVEQQPAARLERMRRALGAAFGRAARFGRRCHHRAPGADRGDDGCPTASHRRDHVERFASAHRRWTALRRYGQSTVRDWSTGTDDAHEHIITLHVWTRASGRKPAHEISSAIEAAIDQQALVLDGHRLITLRHEFSDVRREADNETWRGIVRLRAVTEPF